MARRTTAPARPCPFIRDTTHAGRLARIAGLRGRFKVLYHETNPRTGAAWWTLVGPWTPGDHGQYHHVRNIKLLPVPRARKEP